MPSDNPVQELQRVARMFGAGAAAVKARLLEQIAARPRLRRQDGELLAGAIEFLRAYPDNSAVLRLAHALVSRLDPGEVIDQYAYPVVRRLLKALPGCFELDWESLEDESTLLDVLDLVALPGEINGLGDTRITLREWFERTRPPGSGDLEHLLRLIDASGLPEPVRAHLFDSCKLIVRYRGPRSSELGLPVARVVYQRGPVDRRSFPLAPVIRKPAGPLARSGADVLRLALKALCARNLEIYPLVHGDAGAVFLTDAGRGVRIALVGVEAAWRLPLEVLYFFMLFKNGAPVAYGPAAVFAGCCEMGINLFPEIRGGEIRIFYAQLMRVLHHHLGADYFFLTRYGMGEDNEDALRTGAFWFYRKLGFRPTNPAVEVLARAEEARKAREPGHRSDRRTLKRLSRTEAFFDLSGGRFRPLDFGSLSLAESRRLAAWRAAGLVRHEEACAVRAGRILRMDPRGRALRAVAPCLSLIPDLPSWPRRDLGALARFLRAKDAASEARAARLSSRVPRFVGALRRIASATATSAP